MMLLDFGAKIRPRELFPVLREEAATVIEENPFAFALAAVLDRGTPSEIIWTIPYYLQKKIGILEPKFFVNKTYEELDLLIRSLPHKPRYVTDAPRTLKELSQIIVQENGGDVSRIWKDKSASQVNTTFQRIYGVGPGIASMIVLLLEKCYKIHFPDLDHRTMNVKPDVHIVRVFQRLGFISTPDPNEALKAASDLNPEYPGALDGPTWIIGKRWCSSLDPKCPDCPVTTVCPKNISQSTKEQKVIPKRSVCGQNGNPHIGNAARKEEPDYIEITNLRQFQTIQNRGEGFIVITDTATPTKIHLPYCQWVSSRNFKEKVIDDHCKNGRYYWIDNYALGLREFKAEPCSICKPYK